MQLASGTSGLRRWYRRADGPIPATMAWMDAPSGFDGRPGPTDTMGRAMREGWEPAIAVDGKGRRLVAELAQRIGDRLDVRLSVTEDQMVALIRRNTFAFRM